MFISGNPVRYLSKLTLCCGHTSQPIVVLNNYVYLRKSCSLFIQTDPLLWTYILAYCSIELLCLFKEILFAVYLEYPLLWTYIIAYCCIELLCLFQEILFSVYPDGPFAVEAHLEAGEGQAQG